MLEVKSLDELSKKYANMPVDSGYLLQEMENQLCRALEVKNQKLALKKGLDEVIADASRKLDEITFDIRKYFELLKESI